VDGDFETRAPFWRHNAELIAHVHDLEAKSRRRDILVDEEAIYAFYAERIPSGIYSKPQFEQWLRKAVRKQPKLLHMDLSHVMRADADSVSAEAFPDRLQIGASALPLVYHFDPGHRADGVTLVVPLPLVNQVSPQRLEWLVPGLLQERIAALLRALPKQQRKRFVPIPDTAAKVARRLQPSDRPLLQALGEALYEIAGERVPEDAWDPDAVPEHLRMKVRLVDEQGKAVAEGADLVALKRRWGGEGGDRFADLPMGGSAAALERDGITRWDFGPLPEQIDLDRGGIRLRGFPALVDRGDSVVIRVLDAEGRAADANRAGIRRLIMLSLAPDLRYLRRNLSGLDRMRLQYAKAPVPAGERGNDHSRALGERGGRAAKPLDLADELIALAIDLTFTEGQPPIRDQASFEQRLAASKGHLIETANRVCALAVEILDGYQRLRRRLAGITQVNWMASVLDLQAQLDGLIFRGFLQQVPYGQLKHYPRYLKAADQRAEKLAHAAGRDQERLRELEPLLERWRERHALATREGRHDPRLTEIRWMLEELRVSLFAQQLGTAYPVSIKRIERRWRELGL
jgi:ATP-dependent helicase HrpA